MQLDIALTQLPIESPNPAEIVAGAGAKAEFTGIVRGTENGSAVTALVYEAYAPMAEKIMQDLAMDIARHHPCFYVRIRHRIGVIPVGEAAIHLAVWSRHRAEAFAFLATFMDRLKQDVPIWKVDTRS